MRVLLDECIPRKLKRSFPEYDCLTVPEAGFAGKKNGTLLSLTEDAGFEIFLTIDKGLEYQQNLTGRRISVLVVRSKSNRLRDLLHHVQACRSAMDAIEPGRLTRVGD